MMMLFTKDTFEKALTRYNNIYKSLSEDPILSKIDAKDIPDHDLLVGGFQVDLQLVVLQAEQ